MHLFQSIITHRSEFVTWQGNNRSTTVYTSIVAGLLTVIGLIALRKILDPVGRFSIVRKRDELQHRTMNKIDIRLACQATPSIPMQSGELSDERLTICSFAQAICWESIKLHVGRGKL